MAVVFLLGPGMWEGAKPDPTPMQVRRDIARILRAADHRVVLMEDEDDRDGEDMIGKFDRLLRRNVTDVVLYWRDWACALSSGRATPSCASRRRCWPPSSSGRETAARIILARPSYRALPNPAGFVILFRSPFHRILRG